MLNTITYCHISQWDEIIYDEAFSCFIQNLCPVMSGNALARVQTAAAARTLRSLGHNLLHQRIYRLLVLLKPTDFEAQIYPIEQTALADPSS